MTCLRKRYLAELKKSTINNRQLGNKFLDSADRFEIRNSGIKQRNINGVHTLLDMIGVAEPTGISDGFNALIYLGQGDLKNAGISAIGLVPYVGDTAKGARLGAKALKFADKADDVADTGKALKKAEKAAEAGKTAKAVLKNNQLPTEGEIRYVPPKKWTPSQPLPKKDGQIADKFGNKWIEGSSRTKGQYFEWDVKLSKKERAG